VSGAPRKKFDEMLVAQGTNLAALNKKLSRDSTAAVVVELKAPRAGFVSRCDARIIGEAVRDMGAGRLTKDSMLDYDAGIDQMAKPGERVEKNGVLARIHAASKVQAEAARWRIQSAFEISRTRPKVARLIVETI
jgi:thymidine phosphorylase